jgi:hypothetical protein
MWNFPCHEGLEVQLHAFLTLTQDGGKWLAPRSGCFTQITWCQLMEGWVGYRACLDVKGNGIPVFEPLTSHRNRCPGFVIIRHSNFRLRKTKCRNVMMLYWGAWEQIPYVCWQDGVIRNIALESILAKKSISRYFRSLFLNILNVSSSLIYCSVCVLTFTAIHGINYDRSTCFYVIVTSLIMHQVYLNLYISTKWHLCVSGLVVQTTAGWWYWRFITVWTYNDVAWMLSSCPFTMHSILSWKWKYYETSYDTLL